MTLTALSFDLAGILGDVLDIVGVVLPFVVGAITIKLAPRVIGWLKNITR